jgi:hypothetical protein
MDVAYKSETEFVDVCVCVRARARTHARVLMKMQTGMYQVQNLAKVIVYYNFLLI